MTNKISKKLRETKKSSQKSNGYETTKQIKRNQENNTNEQNKQKTTKHSTNYQHVKLFKQ